jgi:hypothetical protein
VELLLAVSKVTTLKRKNTLGCKKKMVVVLLPLFFGYKNGVLGRRFSVCDLEGVIYDSWYISPPSGSLSK